MEKEKMRSSNIELLRSVAMLMIILSHIVGHCVSFRVKSDTFFNLINIQVFNSMSWFVGYYYTIILIAKFFLNNYLERMDNKKYISFLAVNFAFIQFGWTGGLAEGLIPGLRTLLTGIFLYALGGYFKKYDPLSKLRTYVFFLIIIITYFFVNLSAYNMIENSIENYIRNKTEDDFIQSIPSFPNYSIFDTQDWITLLYHHPYRFVAKISIWSVGAFACGVMVYTFYIASAKLFDRYKGILFKTSRE